MSAPISLADVRGLSLDVDVIARELGADDGDREVALRAINRMQGILARLSLDLIAQDEAGHDCPMAPTYATVDADSYCGHPSHDRPEDPRDAEYAGGYRPGLDDA